MKPQMMKPCRLPPEGPQENYQRRFNYDLARVKVQVLGSCRARMTEAPRSWLRAFRLVRDAQDYGQALQAIEVLALGLMGRGQPAEQVQRDLVQLAPAAYRDAVLPLVHAAAVGQRVA